MIEPAIPSNELNRLEALDSYQIIDMLPEKELDEITFLTAQLCDTPISLITLIDKDLLYIKSHFGFTKNKNVARSISICAHAIGDTTELFEVEDTRKDTRFFDNPLVVGETNMIFYAGMPLVDKNGCAIGVLSAIDHKPGKLSKKQKSGLKTLAKQVMIQLDLKKGIEEQEKIEYSYQALIENIGNVVYEMDRNGNYTHVNDLMESVTGYTKQELLTMNYRQLIYKKDLEKVKKFYGHQIKEEITETYNEFRILHKDQKKVLTIGQVTRMFFFNDKVASIRAIARDISEIEKINNTHHYKKKITDEIYNSPETVTIVQQADGIFYEVDHAIEKIVGYKPEELIGKTPYELFHPEDLQKVTLSLNQVLSGKETEYVQYRIRKKNGQYVWIESFSKPDISDNGEILLFKTFLRDITRKIENVEFLRNMRESVEQTSKKVIQIEAILKTLIENSNYAIWCINDKLQHTTFNKIYAQLYKTITDVNVYKGKEVDYSLIPEQDALHWQNLYDKVLQQGEKIVDETMLKVNGVNIYRETTLNPILNNKKAIIGISASARDIADKKAKDEKLKRFQEGLKLINLISSDINLKYEKLLGRILELSSDFLEMPAGIVAKINGVEYKIHNYFLNDEKYNFVNDYEIEFEDTFCSMTYHSEDILAVDHVSISKYNLHPCHQKLKIDSYIGAIIHTGEEKYGTLNFISLNPRTVPFDSYDKEFVQLVAHWIGAIIKRKESEKKLNAAKDLAENASNVKATFLSMISHEIRTPLNVITGLTHILLDENPREDQLDSLNILKFSSENLLSIINDILDFTNIESGEINFEHKTLSLQLLLNNIKQSLAYKVKEKGLTLKLYFDEELPSVLVGDPIRVTQILVNLISNAVKFTEKGFIKVFVDVVKIENYRAIIHFDITDTGIGIEKEQIDYIFERFTQAKSNTTRKFGGTGLGLSIVKRLLQLMDSDINVYSQVGKGSRFSFDLGFEISESKELSNKPLFKTEFKDLSKYDIHVLLVEDNQMNLMITKKFLERWGIKVTTAQNGKIALKKIYSHNFDMILMDIRMPIMNGYDATKKIRSKKNQYFKEIPIIALTASAMTDARIKTKRVGMNDFISKPVTPDILYQKIIKHIFVKK